MEWSDDGFVLAVRRHGETSAVVSLLTRGHGRHAGLVRGGAGRRAAGILQPGNRVAARWRARLAEHLGTFTCELLAPHAARLLADPLRLAALSSACAVAEAALPEREPHGATFDGLAFLIAALETDPAWPATYVRWEVALLAELGFGLDLASCAATGGTADLAFVSPRTGRAVSAAAGAPYRAKLLALPAFLAGDGPGDPAQVADGLRLAAYFLDRHVFAPHGHRLPAARLRLAERLRP